MISKLRSQHGHNMTGMMSTQNPPEATFDAIVIGGGVVGLAAARALAEAGQKVLIIEKGGYVGQGTSSRCIFISILISKSCLCCDRVVTNRAAIL